jgi:hypothetical protein
MIMVYVDDIFYILRDKISETNLITTLQHKYGKLKIQNLDDGISYVGFKIEKDKTSGDILVSMPKHIENITEDCKKDSMHTSNKSIILK